MSLPEDASFNPAGRHSLGKVVHHIFKSCILCAPTFPSGRSSCRVRIVVIPGEVCVVTQFPIAQQLALLRVYTDDPKRLTLA
jgi:hypothetical protein